MPRVKTQPHAKNIWISLIWLEQVLYSMSIRIILLSGSSVSFEWIWTFLLIRSSAFFWIDPDLSFDHIRTFLLTRSGLFFWPVLYSICLLTRSEPFFFLPYLDHCFDLPFDLKFSLIWTHPFIESGPFVLQELDNSSVRIWIFFLQALVLSFERIWPFLLTLVRVTEN